MPEIPRYRQTFFRLLGFLRPYKASLAISTVFAIGYQGSQIALVWLTKNVIDDALTPRDSHKLWTYVGAVVALGAVRAVLLFGRRMISGRQALAVEMDLRHSLYARLVRLSFGFYDRHQTGQLMSRATVDLQGVRFFLGYGLIFFFQNILTVVFVTGVLFFFEWKLALIALAITPVLVVLAYRYSHVSHPTLREVQQKLADVATVAEENIVGVHVVKSFAQEPSEREKFRARTEAVFDQTIKANRQRAFYVPLISWVPLVAQAAVLLVGARMVTSGELSVGGFVAFNLYLGLLVVPLTSLVPRFYDVTAGRVTIDRADVRDLKLGSLRSEIGAISQDTFLFSASVRENITFGAPGLSDDEIEHVARLAQAHEFIERLPEGYDTVIGERGITLSGGQRQRLAIARAIAVDPRILILDDATASADASTAARIRLGLREAMEGRTTLIIAHRLSTISLADEIVVVDDGRIAARGAHDDLLETSQVYRDIYEHGLLERQFADAVEARALGEEAEEAEVA